MTKEDNQVVYEALREYLNILNKKAINEPPYIIAVREAKIGKIYSVVHKMEDEYGPFRYYHWV